MKALVFHGRGDLRFETVPDAQIADSRDIIVKMRKCSICGSDLHIFHGGFFPAQRSVFGIGHEAIGEVVEKGGGVKNLGIGDMVMLSGALGCGACRKCFQGNIKRCEKRAMQVYGIGGDLEGCQAEAIRVPAGDFNAARIPEGVTEDQATLLTDNLPTAYAACLQADVRPGRSVAVIGLGPIGLIVVEIAMLMGASEVYAIDLVSERRARAAELGATALDADNPAELVREKTHGRMIDSVIEAAGGDAPMAMALALAGIHGTASVLGVNLSMGFRIPFATFANSVTIRANFITEVPKYWGELVPLLRTGRIKPERVITDRVTLDRAAAAYVSFGQRKNGVLKTMIVPP